ncbi:unnamed protein product [Hymenolepis diminuta]|uniref:Transcriptional repressor p66 coiled-coil MBD2-interaction domain-containing protein n=1 Tax=Hymenolepis diminuta TaxID=6216 RepID=A0A564ZCY7_HYMDI|nr:unnamed protein product [Hymenolepis diminuta]
MCSPAKRIKTGADALDLSQKPPSDASKKASDVIVLSEDDDEKATPVGSDTEKENAPGETNGTDWKSVVISLENELRQEEAVLCLLHKLKDSQNPNNNSSNNTSATLKQSSNAQSTVPSNHNVATSTPKTAPVTQTLQRPPSASQTPKVAPPSIPPSSSPLSIPQISKQQAVQALEQTRLSKKAALRKQLDRNLEKVSLPRPPPGSGLSEVAFIPSTAPGDFTSLLGLEEVVKAIQDFDITNVGKTPETRANFKPFSCVKCGTDYTPVWKREKPDSTNVVCEACIGAIQRLSLKKEYDDAVDNIMQQHYAAEREIDKEYQDIVSNPTKLDAYIKEQEKKLMATQQLQLAQQAAYNQRFGAKASTTATPSGLHQSPSTIIGGTSVAAAAHQRSRVATAAATGGGNVAAATQMALQYAKAMNAQGTNPANAAALMMSALANSQAAQAQQQQVAAVLQQQQQRLLAAQLLQSLQHATQQQHQQVATPAPAAEQTAAAGTLNQLQALLVSNILGGAGGVQNAATRAQLLQTMQYLIMQQQQQQQQAQQAAAAQAAAAQQNAALQHIFAQIQSNPSYANFFQQIWPGSGGGAAANNGNQSGANKK